MEAMLAYQDCETLLATDGVELVWNHQTQAVHRRFGVVLGPELARVPFRVLGHYRNGIVIEATVNTTLCRLLVSPVLLSEWRTNALSLLAPYKGLVDVFLELLKTPKTLDAFEAPAPGFSKKGWGGFGSPGYVSPYEEWSPLGASKADATPWLNAENASAGSLARWGRVMATLREHMTKPPTDAASVINAVGETRSLMLLAVLLRLAVGQTCRYSNGAGFDSGDLLGAAWPATGKEFQEGLEQAPGWAIAVAGFEQIPSRSRLLQAWASFPQTPAQRPQQPPVRLVVLSERDIVDPVRPGRAGALWDEVSGQVPVWLLPPAPSEVEIKQLLGSLVDNCPAADPRFQSFVSLA